MSGGFKLPIPGGTPSPYESGGGGDLLWMQLTTLGEYAFAAAILPVLQKSVLKYGLTVPVDPQLLHKAADGWSAISGNVSASGESMRDQHDSVSAASWQALDRAAFGQKVTEFAMGSQAAADSAHRLSWILRVLANLWTAWIYFNFATATFTAWLALAGALSGGGRFYAEMQARSVALSIEQRLLVLRNEVLWDLFGLLVACGAAWGYDKILTNGLK
ncbi:hypothetical protein [Nonomuraea sp. NEAU-A123]|uniref:hypothetical protein n=1 Tax=Nonomuraea sp. NEAU-A123 TaxID=2839649 RepID=UPI001BE3F03E|nr:hypothetical protein [Nonomuraea sp. NEAU-A123]MBT2231619.1 hypothetical protein [Nonomuraea sp. NEAU-A123]